MKLKDVRKAIDRMHEIALHERQDPPLRAVSPQEYDVACEMINEGKFGTGGPKPEFVSEYFDRIRKKFEGMK